MDAPQSPASVRLGYLMTAAALGRVLPDLLRPLAEASGVARRRAVIAVVGVALARPGLSDARLHDAFAELCNGQTGGEARDEIIALAEQFDVIAFDLQHRLEQGEDVGAEFYAAFARARAAAALAAALEPDSLQSSYGVLHEAAYALENPGVVRDIVLRALR